MLEKGIAMVEGRFITANVATQLTRPGDIPTTLNSILSTMAFSIGSSNMLLGRRSSREDGKANRAYIVCYTASERMSDFMVVDLVRDKLRLCPETCFTLA